MKFKYHIEPKSSREFSASFFQKRIYDGTHPTVDDPSAILRGVRYCLWIRPLRLILTLGNV